MQDASNEASNRVLSLRLGIAATTVPVALALVWLGLLGNVFDVSFSSALAIATLFGYVGWQLIYWTRNWPLLPERAVPVATYTAVLVSNGALLLLVVSAFLFVVRSGLNFFPYLFAGLIAAVSGLVLLLLTALRQKPSPIPWILLIATMVPIVTTVRVYAIGAIQHSGCPWTWLPQITWSTSQPLVYLNLAISAVVAISAIPRLFDYSTRGWLLGFLIGCCLAIFGVAHINHIITDTDIMCTFHFKLL